jgi:hypothetical protein
MAIADYRVRWSHLPQICDRAAGHSVHAQQINEQRRTRNS